jgi:hypothetical protein
MSSYSLPFEVVEEETGDEGTEDADEAVGEGARDRKAKAHNDAER